MKIDYIGMKPTKTGKDRWNVKSGEEWYSVWNASLAAQIEDAKNNGYEVEATVERKGDFANITAVLPKGGVVIEAKPDIPDIFKPSTPAPKPTPKPVNDELSMIVEERKYAFHMATLALAAGRIGAEGLENYAGIALRYIHGESIQNSRVEHKIDTADATLDRYVK